MDAAFYRDALFAGMTPSAFKLGTILHLGWFWPRLTGCCLLYRGDTIEGVDFNRIATVNDFDAAEISPPVYLSHDSNTTCFYVLRRANDCGNIERTLSASTRVSIDADGNLVQPSPSSIFTVKARIVQGNRAELTWFYCPLAQQSSPVWFNIYTDNGAGQIDYQNAIAQIEYHGRKFYTFTGDELAEGRYLFAIRAQNENGIEDNSLVPVSVELNPAVVPAVNLNV
jgi:hypothetical protein